MNQKHIGIILITVSLILGSFVYLVQKESEKYADEHMKREGTCYLDDGTCLHKRNLPLYTLGWAVSGALILFAIYLIFIDKTQEIIAQHQIKVSSALKDAMTQERIKDEFNAFLSGFDENEQKILRAIKDQDGIKQSTLRYRTNISKTGLSLVLKEFEEKAIISRKPSGKTKQVFLVKKF